MAVGRFTFTVEAWNDGQNVKTVSVETVRYKTTPIKYAPPAQRAQAEIKAPKLKR